MENLNNSAYFQEFAKAYNNVIKTSGGLFGNVFTTPQLLNTALKDVNMGGESISIEHVRQMIAQPHLYEQSLRRLSFHLYNTVEMYKQIIRLWSNMLEFDSEPIPYLKDGKPISLSDMSSKEFKRDYAAMKKFFDGFKVKQEFLKVLFNMCLYDTYYTSFRTYVDENKETHYYLQELPSSHCMIDSESYLGYLFSLDLSYFTNNGVDINAYSPIIIEQYAAAIKSRSINSYNPNLPNRNGKWICWIPMHPDDAWVFKFNYQFAGSVPPLLAMLIDYCELDKFKDLGKQKDALEAYKVICATVPRLNGNRTGNKTDDFAISAKELGKFVATVKNTLIDGVDFKAAPLEDFKAFDFSSSASSKDIVDSALKNIMKQSGVTDALSLSGTVNVASANIYKQYHGKIMSNLYQQFSRFCEYHISKMTKKYNFKINFVGTMFDKDERIKRANEDMERGIITPAIFSSRGIQVTDAVDSINFMYSLGVPEMFRPIKTASTMSSAEKEGGRPTKNESELSDAGAATRTSGSNNTTKEIEVK